MFDRLLIHRNAQRAIVPLLCLAVLGYLGYHAFVGERGIYTQIRLETEAAALRSQLDAMIAERKRLERRIALLETANLDPDMLDERARAVLNFVHPDEIIILKRHDR